MVAGTRRAAAFEDPGEENAVCLQGSVVVSIEGEEFVLNPGDSISFESGRPHQVENRSTKKAVLISADSQHIRPILVDPQAECEHPTRGPLAWPPSALLP